MEHCTVSSELECKSPVVSSVTTYISTSKWKTGRFALETSVRLTVSVYSPPREQTADCCLIEIG